MQPSHSSAIPALPTLPFHYANRHGILIKQDPESGELRLVTRTNTSYQAVVEMQRFLGQTFKVESFAPDEFQNHFYKHYEDPNRASTRDVIRGLEEHEDWQAVLAFSHIQTDLLEKEEDAPAVRLVNSLLIEAIRQRASDIHIETYERQMSIRLRMDGKLQEIAAPDAALAPMLVSRIKIMAKLDIAEKRMPQDGRLSLRLAGHDIDLRVSIIPVSDGERVVMRLLDRKNNILNLPDLGLDELQFSRLQGLMRKPHGMLLVTGPTGSGKTTTLYSMLTALNDKQRNILTIEDPIEYRLHGIGQTQVNMKTGLTFAQGLRAILRQDPDVIMVGEIRDKETAQIAIQAALTGHLVLSTLHTNSALGAITRLRDMGVESFLISSCLIGVHAQRLVRQLCPHCRIEAPLSHSEREFLGNQAGDLTTSFHPGPGCQHCHGQGYKSREGIHELVDIDSTLQQMIHGEASEHEMEAYVRETTPSIYDHGCSMVRQGVTSVAELVHVI